MDLLMVFNIYSLYRGAKKQQGKKYSHTVLKNDN